MHAPDCEEAAKSTHDIEALGEVGSSAVRRLAPVAGVILEEFLLVLQRRRNRSLVVDIALTTIDDGNVSEAERDDPACENVDDVRSLVPEQCRLISTPPSTSLKTTHMRSTLVSTPIVLVPSGSHSLAIFSPSEFARSVLAAVTARMIELGFMMNLRSISRIWRSISRG